MFSNFLWGSSNGRKNRHWVAWDKISRPKSDEGLGIRSLNLVMKAFRMKSTWNLLTSESLWATFMRSKYIKNRSISSIKLITSASKSWRDIWHCLEEILDISTWEFGPGHISVTHENWLGTGSLAHLFPVDCPQYSLHFAALNDFCIPLFSHDLQVYLKAQYQHLKMEVTLDRRIWPHCSSGSFSIKSYIQLNQGSHQSNAVLKRIWSDFVPTKMAFFCWKLFMNAVPVDSEIIRCNIPIVSRCLCCQSPSVESSTNNMAETRALYDGLQLCEELCIDKVEIQTDSLLVVKWFMQTIEIPWSLKHWWTKIRHKSRFISIQIMHVYREGNSAADYLSKKGIHLQCDGAVNHRTDTKLKQMLLADRNNIPNLRHARN
ncbi:Ribonuclease h domain [Thalictrum thalictroides]|uniref:Ribonuclease h domain n=1 Tax=Thalictrum thalictroides TaxID=46969 RepID=A0A7J6W3L9_THATH|nr:Ribonuclease h domain [Thalictrum thalictroides]